MSQRAHEEKTPSLGHESAEEKTESAVMGMEGCCSESISACATIADHS